MCSSDLVDSSIDAQGRRHRMPVDRPAIRVVSPRTAAIMNDMLVNVVREGTGVKAAIPGYTVAGKTGTAQKAQDGRYVARYVASFAGFAPAEAPRLVCLVVLDEPWEALDPDTSRWLTTTIETKRDRGAAVVVASDADTTDLQLLGFTWSGAAAADGPANPDSSGTAVFFLEDLEIGQHTITVQVTDPDGLTAQDAEIGRAHV